MSYGMPWLGSKSRIAKWVVEMLPANDTLVDLFTGGGAVTHCAMLSGKWDSIIANDITESALIFADAVNGKYADYSTVVDHNEFNQTTDALTRSIYSFGNNFRDYLWSKEMETYKVLASQMLLAQTLDERYAAYAKFVRILQNNGFPKGRLYEHENIQRIKRLRNLEHIDCATHLSVSQGDYRTVEVPDHATVYADPPYRSSTKSKNYDGGFDFDAFDEWLATVDFPVFVSEFVTPRDCVEIARKTRTQSMDANSTTRVVERIFVQERFADMVLDKS